MIQVFRDRGFQIHLTVYIAVNILLFVIDLLGSPGTTWFFWPLIGWGIGIIGHASAVHFRAKKHAHTNI